MNIVVIGSGSSAFAAAIYAATQGHQVTMIEKGTLGGTCVNVGCVPSKIFIRAAQVVHTMQQHSFEGIQRVTPIIQRPAMLAQQQSRVEELRRLKYEKILAETPNIKLLQGTASFVDQKTLSVQTEDTTMTVQADRILIATGSKAFTPPIAGLENTPFWTSTEALQSDALPKHLIVLGGSVVAVELAQAFLRLGTQVTLIARSTLLSKEDPALGETLKKVFEAEGMTVLLHTVPKKVTHDGTSFAVQLDAATLKADKLLVAVGRHANTRVLHLEKAGVNTNTKGEILVDTHMKTSVEHIYASGDCTTQPQYVYVAAAAGTKAAINMLGGCSKMDLSVVPGVTFTDPQIATVGLTETQAKAQGINADSRQLALEHVPRALANFVTNGFIKLVAERETFQIVGAQVIAHEGGEIIQIITTAIKAKMTIKDLASQLFPYLTLAEGIKLCAQTFTKDVNKLSCCAG